MKPKQIFSATYIWGNRSDSPIQIKITESGDHWIALNGTKFKKSSGCEVTKGRVAESRRLNLDSIKPIEDANEPQA